MNAVIFLQLLASTTQVMGNPQAALPVNAQVPPVGRVANPYHFTFSASTFTTTLGALQYNLSNAPPWLQLDGPSRTFSGTPSLQDVGPSNVTLSAQDDSGTTDMQVTFLVSSAPGPALQKPLEKQLASLGPQASPSSLLLYPSSPFNFTFASDTFTNPGGNLSYYAVSADNTPLPSWIVFVGSNLQFSGTTPPAPSPPTPAETAAILLTASDVVGFAGSTASFQLIVDEHEFAFQQTTQAVDVNAGGTLNITNLTSELRLDGHAVARADLQGLDAQVPGWMSFDASTGDVTGTAPQNASTQNFTVTATDSHGDVAQALISVRVHTSLFLGPIPNTYAIVGHPFQYELDASLLGKSDANVTSSTEPFVPWIQFDSSALQWSGDVPESVVPGNITVTVRTSAPSANLTGSETFLIQVMASLAPRNDTTSSMSSPTPRTAPPSSVVPSSMATSTSAAAATGLAKSTVVVVASVVPIVILCAVLALCGLRQCRRRRERQGYRSGLGEISRPTPAYEPFPPDSDTASMVASDGQEKESPPTLPQLRTWSVMWSAPASPLPTHHISLDVNSNPNLQIGVATSDPEIFGRSPLEGFNASRPPINFSLRTPPAPSPPPIPDKSPARKLSKTRPTPLLRRFSSASIGRARDRPRSVADGRVDERRRLSQIGSGYSRLSGITSERQTWTTIQSSDESSRSPSTELLDHFPLPRASTIRIVTSPEPTLDPSRISASRRERYGDRQGPSPLFGGSQRASGRRAHPQGSPSPNALGITSGEASTRTVSVEHFFRQLTSDAGLDSQASSIRERRHGSSGLMSQSVGSRLSEDLTRLCREVSRVTGRLGSTTGSRPSMSFHQGGRFMEARDADGNRRWYQQPAGDEERNGTPSADTPRHSPEAGGGEEAGLAFAVPVTMFRANAPLGLPLVGSRVSNDTSSMYSPRLVDFKPQRPISVEDEGHRQLESREASTAFI
ncbi:MAG: hypothetical protein M1838_000991 [Thelocarpon superellum]|nr:MAG: hypothetical protein M1838_000991 [Thelocarpon superellum]